MRIAVIRNGSSPAVQYYRSVGVFPKLEQETGGQLQFDYYDATRLQWADLYPYELIFIDRPVEPAAFRIIQDVKAMGVRKKVWVDLDDYVFEIPPGNRAWPYYNDPGILNGIKEMLRAVDLITVTTERLQDAYGEFNDNVAVVPNAWNDYDWPLVKPSPANTVIRFAWRGSDIHSADLFPARGVIGEIQRDLAFDIVFFGWNEAWSVFLDIDRKRQVRGEGNIFQYFHAFFSAKADFFIYPLADNEFNRCKSNIAWQEATIAGMATIAPMGFPEFEQPGVIRYKDMKHLRDIMDKIKRGKIVKEEQVELSREALRNDWRLSRLNRGRLEAIARVMGTTVKEQHETATKLKAVK